MTETAEQFDATVTSAAEVAARLEVDPETGLPEREAAARLERYGPNELEAAAKVPAWRRFLRQFRDPLVGLLLVAIAISVAAWLAEGAGGVPIDAIVIVVIVLLNAVIGFVQENRAESAVAALSDMTAVRATVLRDGRQRQLPAAELVPGDVLVLSEGDAVGADARLVSGASLHLLESSLTGESAAVAKQTEPLPAPAGVGDRSNMVFKGTAVASGVGRAVVTGTGMATEMGAIATMLDETSAHQSPLDAEITRMSRLLGGLVIAIAVLVMVTLVIVNGVRTFAEAVDILLMGVSLAVAAVPEGLPAILSLVLAIGVQVLARRNAVMKDLRSVETLGSTSVICSDKTGTLTKNEMTLQRFVSHSGHTVFPGVGYAPEGAAEPSSDAARVEAQLGLEVGATANNAQLNDDRDGWSITGDPTEGAFLVAAKKLAGEHPFGRDRLGEVPFSSERKLMSVLAPADSGTVLLSKGAPDVLLGRCVAEQVSTGREPLTDARREQLLDTVRELSAEGFRTLGVAWRPVDALADSVVSPDDERDLVYIGTGAIIDPPRDEAARAIEQAHRAGIRTIMITGDHPVTAARIAADLGVSAAAHPTAVTGVELDALDAPALSDATATSEVYARVAPKNKLEIVNALREQGNIVAMTGDGVNDAPALKSADIGIAMGITGTEVTKQAADMILGDDNYATIVTAVRQGRVIFDNIKKFMRYLLSSNMGEVATVFLGVVFGGAIGLADPGNPSASVVPLLATQILWINLVTDSGPAMAMGMDPEIDDVMARPPRRPTDRIIDRSMWWRILSIGLVMGLLSLAVFDVCLPGGLLGGLEHLGNGDQSVAVARTTVFCSLVFMQLTNALNSRSEHASAFTHLFTNKWLWLSIVGAIVLQVLVVELPPLQAAFGTVSLDWAHWGVATLAGLAVLGFEEVVKLVYRQAVSR